MSFATAYVDTFLTGMATSGAALYNKIIGQVRGMKDDEIGLVSGSYNTRVIENMAGTMVDFFDSPTYENRLGALINSVPKLTVQILQKYGPTTDDTRNEILDLQDQYIDALNSTVSDFEVEDAIVSPFVNDAFMIVGNNSEVSVLETRARELRDAFEHYFVTKVSTQLEQYEREVIAMIADDNGADRFKFAGPKDARNRDWCHDHVNGIYTREEIEDFANGEWAGQIPGTDATNIWVNLGGYNCRHTLQPIKKK